MGRRKIDTIIAIKAMQWTREDKRELLREGEKGWFTNSGEFIIQRDNWRPTLNLSQAWQVVTTMLKFVNGPGRIQIEAGKDIYSCKFMDFAGLNMSTGGFSNDQSTVQMAICLATLDYLGIEIGDKNG